MEIIQESREENSESQMGVFRAAREGRLKELKYFVDKGASIHGRREYPLRIACLRGHFEIVKYLVEEKGADIHEKEDEALEWATQGKHPEIVAYLKRKLLKEKLLTLE